MQPDDTNAPAGGGMPTDQGGSMPAGDQPLTPPSTPMDQPAETPTETPAETPTTPGTGTGEEQPGGMGGGTPMGGAV